jgi:outer membrane protein TolC
MKIVNLVLYLMFGLSLTAQTKITLNDCYQLVTKNYPIVKQKELLAQKNKAEINVIQKAKLPTLDLAVQASYQSDVTHVPISNPAFNIPSPNKDQYKANLSINQLIYNGGVINEMVDVKALELKAQQKQIDVSLYQLKKQINQLYFSIVLLQEKNELLNQKEVLLTSKLSEVKASVENGMVEQSFAYLLEIEKVKVKQLKVEISNNIQSLLKTMSQLIGESLEPTVNLENSEVNLILNDTLVRPEIDLFNIQKEQLESSKMLLSNNRSPKLMAFALGGYGNPGLNMLDNSFQPYYMVGLKFNWKIYDWNATQQQKEVLNINQAIIDNQKEVFNLNTSIELKQQGAEIEKIIQLLKSDIEIVALRNKIVDLSDAQLKNGIITSSEYVSNITLKYEAEINFKIHQIQLKLAKANYNVIKGN